MSFSTFIIYHTWAHVKTVEQILWEDYSAPYSEPFFPFSLIQNRTGDFGASFALLGRKALQPFLQTFATIPANVCNRPRKRLREKMPLFRLYTLYIYIIREPYGNLICTGFVSSGHVSMARHSYPHKKQEREKYHSSISLNSSQRMDFSSNCSFSMGRRLLKSVISCTLMVPLESLSSSSCLFLHTMVTP